MSASADLAALVSGPPLEVAPRLLGAVVRHGEVAVRLTEVEAYAGAADPGSHAHRGLTARNEVMFGPAGRLYVYFTYGMHHCANVVCGPTGEAGAVLLRSGEVVEGIDAARARRGVRSDRDLARGPARLCQALGVDLGCNGVDLEVGPLLLEPVSASLTEDRISRGPRVGLRLAPERPWRFWETGSPWVSAYRPAAPRGPRRAGPTT